MAQFFRQGRKTLSGGDENVRAKLSHLRDLQHRLVAAKLQSASLLAAAPQLAVQECLRARGRVLKHNERRSERSDAMIHPFTIAPMKGYFKRLSSGQGDFCMDYTRRYMVELQSWDLDRQRDDGLTLLGQIAAEQHRYDEFEALAEEMAAEHWERVILLADAAVTGRNRPLAERVLELVLSSNKGWHVNLLQRKLDQLKRGQWNPDPKQ